MDVRMPKLDGIQACREIRSQSPDTHVLMLTSFADDQAVMAALLAGASGFLLKDVRTEGLIEAMRVVAAGGSMLDSSSASAIIDQVRRGNLVTDEDRLAQSLTDRELEILDLIAEGLTNREIGARLYLSEKTVKHHVSDVLAKLGFGRRVEAAAFAIKLQAGRRHNP
jgi:DNA-binding NarL/FixJ family response regulator